jgi:hypothetical protein
MKSRLIKIKPKFIQLITMVAFGLSLSSNASALPISYAGYTLDEATNIVTGGGLEWLQWDETDGMTISDALATYHCDGWGLASNVQMAALFNAFNIGEIAWDNLENTGQHRSTGFDSVEPNDDTDRIFVNIFGNTGTEHPSTGTNDLEAAYALFGNDLDADGFFNTATVADDFTFYYNGIHNQYGEASITEDNSYFTRTWSSTYYGIALVRSNQPPEMVPDVQVPAPTTLALLGLGLAGMTIVRRRQNTPAVQN